MRKLWIYILIGLVVIFILFRMFFSRDNVEIELVTQEITQGEVEDIISSTGTVKALNTVDVGTQVSGVIDEIYVDFNSQVKKGQVLARLDTRTLSANVADARAALQKSQLLVEQAGIIHERSKKLFEDKLISQEEYDRSKYEFETAQLNVQTARTALDRAQVNLGYATIISPVDGIVISRTVEKGQTVAAAFTTPTLFTIAADLKEMIIEADIDEADIGKVKTEQHVEFFVDAFPDELFKGNVKQIRLQPKTIQNVVNYTVVISLENPDMKLFPGMTANLSIIAEHKEGVIVVPSASLNYALPDEMPEGYRVYDTTGFDENEIGKRARVWVISDKTINARVVETGVSDGAVSEITSGLKEKEFIITGVLDQKDLEMKKKKSSPLMPNIRKSNTKKK